MRKKTPQDLKALFKQAAEIAQEVPESMHEAAFNRALDLLTGGGRSAAGEHRPQRRPQGAKRSKEVRESTGQEQRAARLRKEINSTEHPEVAEATKVLDRSLHLLRIASDHGIDGLAPAEIAGLLTEKFRVATHRNAVNMALSKATILVDRQRAGRGYEYRIMKPGEDYLNDLGRKKEPPTKGKTPRRTPAKPKRRKKKSTARSPAKKRRRSEKGTSAATSRKPGPKATLEGLIASGFFSKGRTGAEVQGHLARRRGLSFGMDQIRMAMLRLVRDKALERDLNEDGQYEYQAPT